VGLAACFGEGWYPRRELNSISSFINEERRKKEEKAAIKAKLAMNGRKTQSQDDSISSQFRLVGAARPGHVVEALGRRFVKLQIIEGSKSSKYYICLNENGDNEYVLYYNHISIDAGLIVYRDDNKVLREMLVMTNIVYQSRDGKMFAPIGELVLV
jgi:hypothetical protein